MYINRIRGYMQLHMALSSEGSLELFLGSMYSGKTTELVKIFRTYQYIGNKITVVNFSGDTRYHETLLSTHDKIMIPCVLASKLTDIWNDASNINYTSIREADVVLINEGQFFQDLLPIVLEMVETYHKHVYIFGLDGDFQRNKFGQMLDFIPYCDRVTKLHSLCSSCKNGKKGLFSHRLSQENAQIVIGNDNYQPLCRYCYISKTFNETT